MNVFLSTADAKKLMARNGGFFMGQTAEIAPIDKKLYAMRDVTDTVESIPLITASILSKKLAEGIGGLVMDVKFGTGAFMQKKDDAFALAQSIAAVGRASGVSVCCVLSDMGSPLGDRAGNSLEIIECVEVFKRAGSSFVSGAIARTCRGNVNRRNPNLDRMTLRKKLEGHLTSGRAFDVFSRMIHAQGGDASYLENTSKFPQAPIATPIVASKTGFVSECDTRSLGLATIELGGGRLKSSDVIDPSVGLSMMKRVGDKIERGEPLAIIHASDKLSFERASQRVQSAYEIGDAAGPEPLIWKKI